MQLTEWIAVAINLALGIYFIHFYPKTQARIFRGHPIPKGFIWLRTLMRIVGVVAIGATLIYVVLRLSGTMGADFM
ncbi:MAG: hypothetical protein AB1810_14250 [Pseudomonadota bacterium]